LSDELTEQIRGELERIQPVVTRLLSTTNRWNGSVELVESDRFKGRKRFDCGIEIEYTAAQSAARWRTLIHEMIHAQSTGLTREDFRMHKGWEEGTVENLQRLIRGQVLAEIGVTVDEAILVADDATYTYEQHVKDLEALRVALNQMNGWSKNEPEDKICFYRDLLDMQLKTRPVRIMRWARNMPPERSRAFLLTYASVFRRLSDVG
jgi:hypothetical protein